VRKRSDGVLEPFHEPPRRDIDGVDGVATNGLQLPEEVRVRKDDLGVEG
jgi:hypothetical protein